MSASYHIISFHFRLYCFRRHLFSYFFKGPHRIISHAINSIIVIWGVPCMDIWTAIYWLIKTLIKINLRYLRGGLQRHLNNAIPPLDWFVEFVGNISMPSEFVQSELVGQCEFVGQSEFVGFTAGSMQCWTACAYVRQVTERRGWAFRHVVW